MTNTRRNLDKVRNILLRYSETKQVEIEAKFMEVNQGVLKELGFNWNVSKKNGDGTYSTLFSTAGRNTTGTISTYNNRTLASTITSASAGSTPITILKPAAEVTADVPNPYTVDPVVPVLPSTINMASGAAQAANTVLGVINGYDVSLIVDALEQRQGSDLLCAPKVTVISGSTASNHRFAAHEVSRILGRRSVKRRFVLDDCRRHDLFLGRCHHHPRYSSGLHLG